MTNREVLAARIWHQLEGVEEYLGNRDDRREIVDALLSSVVAQEMTRMAVTKNRMNTEGKSDIDKDRLIAYWRVLAHHYRGTKDSRQNRSLISVSGTPYSSTPHGTYRVR